MWFRSHWEQLVVGHKSGTRCNGIFNVSSVVSADYSRVLRQRVAATTSGGDAILAASYCVAEIPIIKSFDVFRGGCPNTNTTQSCCLKRWSGWGKQTPKGVAIINVSLIIVQFMWLVGTVCTCFRSSSLQQQVPCLQIKRVH